MSLNPMKVDIRLLKREDAYTSQKWRNDPEVFKYTGNTYFDYITIESELKWIDRVIKNKDEYRCAIIADGEYVGNIYLTGIEKGRADYHIFIGKRQYWGKGVARKASKLIIEYGFLHLNLKEIRLKVREENFAARKLYERLGFINISSQSPWLEMILTLKDFKGIAK